jgi:signal transduction histidine kinase/HAMP domain-containing protein
MLFADLPIRRKLLTMALAITAIVLLASCAVLIAFDLVSLRKELKREFGTLSDVIAANSSAVLAFNAREDATELLNTIGAERSVQAAALYDSNGQLFASFGARELIRPSLEQHGMDRQEFSDRRLLTYRRINEGGKELGTLVVSSDLRWWYQRMWLYAGVSAGVILLAFVAATIISGFLRKTITRPIDELARIAGLVSDQGNFSVRAQRFGNDELGALTDTFNHMLSQIQERESELRESEAQRLIALEAAGLGTWRYDPVSRMSSLDGTLNGLLGLDPLPSVTPFAALVEHVHPDDRELVRKAYADALGKQGELELEYRVLRSDGQIRWFRDRGRVLPGKNEKGAYMAGAVLDITQRKASEAEILRLNVDLERRVALRTAELEDSNRNLEAFAYSVSHDLRAPLRIISGYAEVLMEDRGKELPEDHRMCLSRIIDGARKMNRLIDDLLHFSRLGKQPLKFRTTEMAKLVDDVLGELERETMNRKIEWIRPPLPNVQCDPGLMRQVFSNLLSNALKYSRPRNPAIVEIGVDERGADFVFFVRDNGVGFDSSASSRLFGVFQRLHSAQEFEGNGVGLATAARIIRRHGGRIWAESQPDLGATFFFTLPRVRTAEEMAAASSSPWGGRS